MAKALDITGERYGRLVAIEPTVRRQLRNVIWRFQCDCGNIIEAASGSVRRGAVTSCGCFRKESAAKRGAKVLTDWNVAQKTHGHTSGGRPSPTFTSWVNMIQRCTNPNNNSYPRYGGRGITVDPRWMIFENFLADMGERPAGWQLDRIDNDLGYSKENCRWVTPKENGNNRGNNRKITFEGVSKTLSQWAETLGCDHQALSYRLENGWSVEEALSTPFVRGNNRKIGVP